MWLEIDGVRKIYKSINFSLLEDKLMDGTKSQTARTKHIPFYKEYEFVVFTFKKKPRFICPIDHYYPKQIFFYTIGEARRDGFNSIEEFQDKLMEINNIKSKLHWSFLILWNPLKRIMLEVIGKNGAIWICKTKDNKTMEAFM